mmetsp:Transcript_37447/g.81359  ORF Transcript_37447/g.81359 Transcript_37447/m.81359 type:complete len:252 (+) Transcript_37447:206-961(+)
MPKSWRLLTSDESHFATLQSPKPLGGVEDKRNIYIDRVDSPNASQHIVTKKSRPIILAKHRRPENGLFDVQLEQRLDALFLHREDVANHEPPQFILVVGVQKPMTCHVGVTLKHIGIVGHHVRRHVVEHFSESPRHTHDTPSVHILGGLAGVSQTQLAIYSDGFIGLCIHLPREDVLLRSDNDRSLEGEIPPQNLMSVQSVRKNIKRIDEHDESRVFCSLQKRPIGQQFVQSSFPLAFLAQDGEWKRRCFA